MTLTPTLKFIIVAFAVLTSAAMLIWTGIKTDLTALDVNEHVFNIILVVIVIMDKTASALLAYLGIRNPIEPPPE